MDPLEVVNITKGTETGKAAAQLQNALFVN